MPKAWRGTGRESWLSLAAVLAWSLAGSPGCGEEPARAEKKRPAPAGSVQPAPAVQDKPRTFNAMEQAVVAAVNAERKKKDLPPLEVEPRLREAAQRHAVAMAEAGQLEHELEGKGAGDRIKDAGYEWRAYGENIAEGYESAAEAVAGWMKSEGHRGNILDEKNYGFTQTGVGIHKAKDGTLYFCQVFARPAR